MGTLESDEAKQSAPDLTEIVNQLSDSRRSTIGGAKQSTSEARNSLTSPKNDSRLRSKSCDTSDILSKLAGRETRYFHKDIWTDCQGNVFRGRNPDFDQLQLPILSGGGKRKKPKTKKIVFLEMKIKRISDIDTSRETFRCRFHYYLTWLASSEEWAAYKADKESYTPEWTPKIDLTNAAEVHQHFQGSDYSLKTSKNPGFNDEWRIGPEQLGFPAKNGKWNRVRYEGDVTFAEELELEAFPFDCQDLSIFMKVEKDKIDSCDIVAFPREGDFCLLDPQFSVLSEWYLENLVTEFGYTDPLKSKSLRCYSIVSVHIKASRRWEAHVGMIIVTFCMFALGMGSFSMSASPDQLGERLGFCVTFLLADVATLQLMFDHLPLIPYWTILDYYIYSSFIFLFLITIWSCAAGAIDAGRETWLTYLEHMSDEDTRMMDHIAFWVFLFIFLSMHFGYIGSSVYHRRRERAKLTMTTDELSRHFEGEKSAADRRAISNTWDPASLEPAEDEESAKKGAKRKDHKGRDVTTFHFQGAKLERMIRKHPTRLFGKK